MTNSDTGSPRSDSTENPSGVLAVCVCAVLIVVCGLVIYRSLVSKTVYYDPLGPAGVPIGVALAIIGLCAVYIVVNRKLIASIGRLFHVVDRIAVRQILLSLAWIIVYVFILSFKAIPFVIPTFALLIALGMTVSVNPLRRIRPIVVMALITTIIVYGVFIEIFLFDLG